MQQNKVRIYVRAEFELNFNYKNPKSSILRKEVILSDNCTHQTTTSLNN